MPLAQLQRRRLAAARLRRVALACALVCAGLLVAAGPASAGPILLSSPTLERSGRTLSTDNGSWLGSTDGYTYAWQRCDLAVSSCATVPGRTASTYLLSTPDIGKRIRSVVGAGNPVLGASNAPSGATDPIAPAPPVNVTLPLVTLSGTKLTSTLGTWSDPSPNAVAYGRRWQRCSGSQAADCESISGPTGATYSAGPADDGKFLRVVVGAEGLGVRSVASPPAGPVALPAAPGGGGGGGGGGSGGGGNSSPPVTNDRPAGGTAKLRPFPKVVVAGRLARGLTFISGLVIRRGPRGARVAVSCRGRGCPRGRFRGRLNRSGALRLRRFQRIFGPGAVIEIRVTQAGAIGKFTRLRVRAKSVPARRDACLMPSSSRPRRCP
jgi:hypothetical protein